MDTEALAMEVDEILSHELDGLHADLHQDCMCDDDLINAQVLNYLLPNCLELHLRLNPATDASHTHTLSLSVSVSLSH
jgi:hypothetical protein